MLASILRERDVTRGLADGEGALSRLEHQGIACLVLGRFVARQDLLRPRIGQQAAVVLRHREFLRFPNE